MTVYHECEDCAGTGLYSGMCEAKGTAVVCLGCRGSGKATLRLKAFNGRKPSRGIETVSWSRGSFIGTVVGSVGESITYAEFAAGKLPPKGVR